MQSIIIRQYRFLARYLEPEFVKGMLKIGLKLSCTIALTHGNNVITSNAIL